MGRIKFTTGHIMDRVTPVRNSLSGILSGCAILCVVLAAPTSGWSAACSQSQLKAAESAVADLGSWKKMYSFFSKFRGCDDGGTSEDVTEAIVRLMSDRWEDLQEFANAAKKDSSFAKFVLSHVDSTADTGDLKKIRANASQRCPAGLAPMCKQIGDAARSALK